MGSHDLSDASNVRIREILTSSADIGPERIDEVVWCIKASVGTAMILEGSGSAKESRDELIALHDVIADLLRNTHKLSGDSKMLLDHFVNDDDFEHSRPNQRLRPSRLPPLPYQGGEGLHRLQIYAEAIEKAASKALAEIKVKRKVKPGTKPNITGRSIALHLRETFEDFGVPVTSYESGPYMEILETVFSDLLPTEGQQAYLRHGKWAARLEDNYGTNFASVVSNGNE